MKTANKARGHGLGKEITCCSLRAGRNCILAKPDDWLQRNTVWLESMIGRRRGPVFLFRVDMRLRCIRLFSPSCSQRWRRSGGNNTGSSRSESFRSIQMLLADNARNRRLERLRGLKKNCCSSLLMKWMPCSFAVTGHLGDRMPRQSEVEEAWMHPLPRRVVEN